MQKILLVDDEADILESLKPLLEGALQGVEVRTAASGNAALELLRSERVDLIISDYKMPRMNGLDFLREADRAAPGVPRMLITAFPDLEIAIRAINEAGIESFITKPFNTEEILAQVRAALLKRHVDALWRASLARAAGKAGDAFPAR